MVVIIDSSSSAPSFPSSTRLISSEVIKLLTDCHTSSMTEQNRSRYSLGRLYVTTLTGVHTLAFAEQQRPQLARNLVGNLGGRRSSQQGRKGNVPGGVRQGTHHHLFQKHGGGDFGGVFKGFRDAAAQRLRQLQRAGIRHRVPVAPHDAAAQAFEEVVKGAGDVVLLLGLLSVAVVSSLSLSLSLSLSSCCAMASPLAENRPKVAICVGS